MTAATRFRGSLAPLFLATIGAAPLQAQGVEGQLGRFYEDGGWDVYRLGVSRPLGGTLGLGLQGNYLQRADGGDGALAGLSLDLTAFKGGGKGPYLVAGVGAGMGSTSGDDFSDAWGSWSVGGGYQLLPASFLSFAAEARWRELSLDAREGLEMMAGLSIRFGSRGDRSPQPAAPAAPPAELPPPMEAPPADRPPPPEGRNAERLRQDVVATATKAMGRPYEWGGTGTNGGGFDCSGLIQHAYGQHGIRLPRVSRDQAKEGRPIARNRSSLRAGDLLTFSSSGGPVTHVGLYIGDGRFIHSASRGVQVSLLSGDDPYGRWWYKRWVGVRRIVED